MVINNIILNVFLIVVFKVLIFVKVNKIQIIIVAIKTIAVLGSGFNYIYPKENLVLYKEILEEGGCVISEYEPNQKADLSKFPMRNRVISGIALGVLLIEARYRSGSTITARYAFEQRKNVFCIPHNIESKTGYSPNEYIKYGAKLVTNYMDIL